MPWGGRINNGPCGFLMECCNYFLPLQLKCNSILPIYHLYDSDKKHRWMFVFLPCLIPCSHLWISALIESCCNYLLSPLTACSGGPLTLALKNGDGKWLPLVSFILGSSWLLFGVQVIFEKQGSSIKTTYADDFFWSCIVSFLMQSLTSSAHAGYSAVPRPV